MKRGRHGVTSHIITVATATTTTCWTMIAQAPPPRAAMTTATTAPARAAAICRISSDRKSIARVSSASWVTPSETITNEIDTAMNRGLTSGSR